MLRKLRPVSSHAIAVSLGVAVLLVVGTLVASAISRHLHVGAVDWGTVPAWFSALFGLGTLLGVGVAALAYLSNQAQRRDDETAPARLLAVTQIVTHNKSSTALSGPAYVLVRVTLRNVGSAPVSQIHIDGVTHKGVACQQFHADFDREFADDRFRLLRPDQTVTTAWIDPTPDHESDPHSVRIGYRYLDGNGRRWHRINNNEPRPLLYEKVDEKELHAFTTAVTAREDQPIFHGATDFRTAHDDDDQ